MKERKSRRTIRTKANNVKKVVNKKAVNSKKKINKTKIKPIIIVDYIFLISLVLSIFFGMQTNTAIFFVPFTITLLITLICMGIILVNSLYCKIKKKISRKSDII